jgi:hypothetical protein
MIIPGNASLAILSFPQEPQGTKEEDGGFGELLTEIEHHATALPTPEEGESRALESVLQVLMSMFQSCTPVNALTVASGPGTGEAGLVSVRPAGGLPLGLPPGLGTAPALGGTGGVTIPPGMVAAGSLDMSQLAFPETDGQSTEVSPAAAAAPQNLSLLLHRQESTQNLSGLFMARPTAALSVSTPTVEVDTPAGVTTSETTASVSQDSVLAASEAQLSSPGRLQASPTNAGEGHASIQETPPQPPNPHSAPMPVGTQHALDGISGPLPPLPPGEGQGAGPVPQVGLVSQTVAPERTALQAQYRPGPPAERTPTTPPVGPEVLQSISMTSQPSPVNTAPATPWAAQVAAPPLTEDPTPLPTAPKAETAAASSALLTMALTQEDSALPERDASPSSHRMPESPEHAPEAMPSVPHLTADQAFPSALTRATSHTSSAEAGTAVPQPSQPLEDMARQWPRPLPANTMLLQLEPRELGALLLQVRVSDKRLIASFRAQSPEAEAILRTHLPSLHESLSQHGFEVQPIAVTLAAEGFGAHVGTGTGAFAHQHSAFQAFAQEQQAASAGETQSEVDLNKTPRWPTEQKPRLLDVVI